MRAACKLFYITRDADISFEDGHVNITFHAAPDAIEVFVKVFSQAIKATPLHQFMTQACEFWRKRRGVNAHTYAHARWNGSPSGHGMHALLNLVL